MKKAAAQKSKNSNKRGKKEATRVDAEPHSKKVHTDQIDFVLFTMHIVI